MLYIASEVIVGDTCIPSLIVINNTINQLETNNIYCLRLFVVVYKHVASEEIVGERCVPSLCHQQYN